MTLRVVNQAEEAWLDLITDVDMTIRLFTNDVESGLTEAQKDALTQASFTEATFTGYAAVSMTTAWTTTQGDPSTATRAQVAFTSTSDANNQTVRGYYVTRNSDGALQWYEYFDGPILVDLNGDAINVTPTLTLDDDQEATVVAQGVIAQQVITTTETAHTVDGVTDFVLNNVPVVAGRMYAIHLHSIYQLTGASVSRWFLSLRLNGAVIARIGDFENNTALAQTGIADCTCFWTAPTTQATDDFDIFADEFSGAQSLAMAASATAPRTFTIIDMGVAP